MWHMRMEAVFLLSALLEMSIVPRTFDFSIPHINFDAPAAVKENLPRSVQNHPLPRTAHYIYECSVRDEQSKSVIMVSATGCLHTFV